MKQELERLLAQNDTFMVEGVLNKNKLAELARQYNPELLNILMSDEKSLITSFLSWRQVFSSLRRMSFYSFSTTRSSYQIALPRIKLKLG